MFAVDCQTWVLSVLGMQTVDGWFGAGTSLNIWTTAMKLGGYVYVGFYFASNFTNSFSLKV